MSELPDVDISTDLSLEPPPARDAELDRVLATLTEDPNEPDAWVRLIALGRPALSETRQAEMEAAFRACSLALICERAEMPAVARVNRLLTRRPCGQRSSISAHGLERGQSNAGVSGL
jgi:hypothetical protein